jgi:hypothetical protein
MIRLDITVDDIAQVMAAGYTVIRVYTDTSETGTFVTLDGTATLVAVQTEYAYVDTDGTTSTWYKVAYYGVVPGESTKSAAQQGGTLDAYCTSLDVRKELAAASGRAAVDEDPGDVIWDMCVEASRLIDEYKMLEHGAYLASGSEVRYFDGTGHEYLWILDSPATSITTVEVEETDGTWTTWVSNDYFTWPYNETPIRRLDVSDRAVGDKTAWTLGPRRVRLTGVFGWSTTAPALIERACKIQVARWYHRAQQGWQDAAGTPEFGELRYVRELDPDVKIILDHAEPHPEYF